MADGNHGGGSGRFAAVPVALKSVLRVEIDNDQPPFRSVREVVSLFGEKPGRVSSANIDKKIISEVLTDSTRSPESEKYDGATTCIESELKEAKQSLEKAKEESIMMEKYLFSLKEELERTKKELQQFKEHNHRLDDDLNYVQLPLATNTDERDDDQSLFGRRSSKTVKFTHPTLSDIIIIDDGFSGRTPNPVMLERHPSLRKEIKKKMFNLRPLIGGLFAKRMNKFV